MSTKTTERTLGGIGQQANAAPADTKISTAVATQGTSSKDIAVVDDSLFAPQKAADAGSQLQVFGGTPYIGWYSPKTKDPLKGSLDAAQVGVQNFYLKDSFGVVQLKPFKFHLVRGFACFVKIAKSEPYDVVGVKHEYPGDGQGYQEQIVGLLLVIHNNLLVPAIYTARSAMCPVLKNAHEAIKEGGAATDANSWGARSERHRISAATPLVPARFNVSAWAKVEKGDGEDANDFHKGFGQINPSSVDEIVRFKDYTSSDGGKRQIGIALTEFNRKVSELREQAAK